MGTRLCHYCGLVPGVTRDHIVPKALGGPNIGWNYVPSCVRCNNAKADRWPTCECGKCTNARKKFRAIGLAPMEERARGNATDYFAKLLRDMKYGEKG